MQSLQEEDDKASVSFLVLDVFVQKSFWFSNDTEGVSNL
jgi:hypothetical protein